MEWDIANLVNQSWSTNRYSSVPTVAPSEKKKIKKYPYIPVNPF